MKRWSNDIKDQARGLRKSGLSYGEISKKLGIRGSTLHPWISDLKRPGFTTEADKKAHLLRIQKLAVESLKRMRIERLLKISNRVTGEVKRYPVSDISYLRSLLSMLYWAEGGKTRGALIFANTDPKMALLFITLMRRCHNIDESKLRIRIHLHHYHDIEKSKEFWSNLLNVPLSQFGKIHIKKRSLTKHFRENFAGICFIKYHSESLRYELLERAAQIQALVCLNKDS